jgi:hypothetical protein
VGFLAVGSLKDAAFLSILIARAEEFVADARGYLARTRSPEETRVDPSEPATSSSASSISVRTQTSS